MCLRILASIALLLGVLFLLIANKPQREFEGFSVLKWDSLEHFKVKDKVSRAVDRMNNLVLVEGNAQAQARSQIFTLLADNPVLRFMAPTIGQRGSLLVTLSEQESGQSYQLEVPFQNESNFMELDWKEIELSPPLGFKGKKVQLLLKLNLLSPAGAEFRIRSRVDYYSSSLNYFLWLWVQGQPALSYAVIFSFCVVLSCLGVCLLKQTREYSLLWQSVLYTMLALVNLRWNVYYFWDEWHVVEAFQRMGWDLISYAHNEHYLPLYWLVYFSELSLFGERYGLLISVSFFLHISNCLMVRGLLRELLPLDLIRPGLLMFVTAVYALHPLHAEVLGWAFVQCVLLQNFSFLVGSFCALRFVKGGGWNYLLCCFVMGLSAPLFFGNGFIALVQIVVFAAGGLFLHSEFMEKKGAGEIGQSWLCCVLNKGEIRRFLFIVCALGIGAIICGGLYYQHRYGLGHSLASKFEEGSMEFRWRSFFVYLLVSSQMGTIVRGFGLLPSLSPDAAMAIYSIWPFPQVQVEVPVGISGLMFSLVILAFVYYSGKKEQGRLVKGLVLLWLLGQFVAISSMLLPAIGRHLYPARQGLSLRYHSGSVLVVVLILYAVLFIWINRAAFRDLFRMKQAALFVVILFMVCSWVKMSFDYSDYARFGVANREYLEQEARWRECQEMPVSECRYTSADFNLRDSDRPSRPYNLTNELKAEQLLEVQRWLKK